MARLFWCFACLSGAVAVGLGAFAAHGLKSTLSSYSLAVFQTGVQYQMLHALALLVAAYAAMREKSVFLCVTGWCWMLGTLLFSGSLYALAFVSLGAWALLTPLGGLAFMIGWISLAIFGWQQARE